MQPHYLKTFLRKKCPFYLPESFWAQSQPLKTSVIDESHSAVVCYLKKKRKKKRLFVKCKVTGFIPVSAGIPRRCVPERDTEGLSVQAY